MNNQETFSSEEFHWTIVDGMSSRTSVTYAPCWTKSGMDQAKAVGDTRQQGGNDSTTAAGPNMCTRTATETTARQLDLACI